MTRIMINRANLLLCRLHGSLGSQSTFKSSNERNKTFVHNKNRGHREVQHQSSKKHAWNRSVCDVKSRKGELLKSK